MVDLASEKSSGFALIGPLGTGRAFLNPNGMGSIPVSEGMRPRSRQVRGAGDGANAGGFGLGASVLPVAFHGCPEALGVPLRNGVQVGVGRDGCFARIAVDCGMSKRSLRHAQVMVFLLRTGHVAAAARVPRPSALRTHETPYDIRGGRLGDGHDVR